MTRTNCVQRVCAPSLVLAVLIAAGGCDTGPVTLAADPESSGVSVGTAVGPVPALLSAIHEVVAFDPTAGEYPEGIAAGSDGGIYVGLTGLGEIRRIDPSGAMTTFATIPLEPGDLGVLGLTFSADRTLYAAVVSASPSAHGVWRIDRGGAATHVAGTEAMAFPNDLTFDQRGHLYITDSVMGAVWRLSRDGSFSVWALDPLLEGTGVFGLGFPIGANGVAFLPGRSGGHSGRGGPSALAGRLLVANTERGQLVEIGVLPDGSAGASSLVATGEVLIGLDGLAADPQGRIYGAVNVGNAVVLIEPGQGSIQTVATGLDFPAGLTFGTRGAHRHSLFVTNFALINEVDPSPGVVRLDLAPPGRR
jgi:sugar lactone lactonase YvrE